MRRASRKKDCAMYKRILIPVNLADLDLAKPAIDIALTMAQTSDGSIRLVNVLNVLPMMAVMLDAYVPPDSNEQQRTSSEETLAGIARECGLPPGKMSSIVRRGVIYHEVLEEAKAMGADLIVMGSHRPAMRNYFLGSNAGYVVRYT